MYLQNGEFPQNHHFVPPVDGSWLVHGTGSPPSRRHPRYASHGVTPALRNDYRRNPPAKHQGSIMNSDNQLGSLKYPPQLLQQSVVMICQPSGGSIMVRKCTQRSDPCWGALGRSSFALGLAMLFVVHPSTILFSYPQSSNNQWQRSSKRHSNN